MSEVDYGDVQGLVRFGYKRMTEVSYVLLRVKNAAAARAWLRGAPISNSVEMVPPPKSALQVAFTAAGLKALGLADSVLAQFSPEFISGMADPNRSRRLGDVGVNQPAHWDWGYGESEPHLLVMFFAEPGLLAELQHSAIGPEWVEGFEIIQKLKTGNLHGLEPFGFADGISHPELDWTQQREPKSGQIDYRNVVALGEFLLGYRNEYEKYTDRPLLDGDATNAGLLPAAEEPAKRDLGRNGTYLVMRQLRQDVRGFWQFMREQSGGDAEKLDQLAARMVGRTRAGDPLVPLQNEPIAGIGKDELERRKNRFTFDEDPAGARCPFGAHIRRANPRNTDFPGRPTGLAKLFAMLGLGRKHFREDLLSAVRFHRILRRGREYGPWLSPENALEPAPSDDAERGLHFICLNANISRQFEFLQNAWMANTKFDGLSGESDPLLGNRQAIPGCPITGDFNVPKEGGLRQRVSGLPQFVTVRGGAYFFLPSLRAVRYLAGK